LQQLLQIRLLNWTLFEQSCHVQTIERATRWSDPRGVGSAISSHLSVEGRGLYHHDEAAKRWCSRILPPGLNLIWASPARHL